MPPALQSFVTERGEVPYWEILGARESFRLENGDELERHLLVDWENRDKLRLALLADVSLIDGPIVIDAATGREKVTRRIRRLMPEAHPRIDYTHAVAFEETGQLGYPDMEDGGQPGTELAVRPSLAVRSGTPGVRGMVRCVVTYRNLPYDLATDDEADAFGNELCRFVSRRGNLNTEAAQIGGSAYKFCPPGQVLPIGQESPVKTLSLVDVEMTLHLWPGIPDAIAWLALNGSTGSGGRVNDRPFDPLSRYGIEWPVGNLLYAGAEIGDWYRSPTGVKCWDIVLKMQARPPKGWNFIFRRSQAGSTPTGFREVTVDGVPRQVNEPGVPDNERPFDSFDFRELLQIYDH